MCWEASQVFFGIPNKSPNCTWHGLLTPVGLSHCFFYRAFQGPFYVIGIHFSTTEPGEHGSFSRLPDYQRFQIFRLHAFAQASTCYVLGISWKLWVIGTKPYLQRWLLLIRKAYPTTLPKLDCKGWRVGFSRIFEVRSYKMVGGI